MIRINLLPARRGRRRLVPESGVVSALLLVIAALASAYLYGVWENERVQAQTNAINRELVVIRPKVAEVLRLEALIEQLRAREDLLRLLEARQLPWPDMLIDLAKRTPSDAWLSSASVGGTGTLHLSLAGSATSYASVARFMTNMAASRFYSDVDLQGAQGNSLAPAHVITFGLSLTLRPVDAIRPEGAR